MDRFKGDLAPILVGQDCRQGENNRKAEEEERLRREELAKKMANGEDLTDEALKEIFEKHTAKADADEDDSDKNQNK